MSLPLVLPAGTIAVYGIGTTAPDRAPSGLLVPENFRMGTVYNIWDGGAAYVYGGDVVFWRDGSDNVKIVTQENLTYTILPARLVTKDFIVP